MSISTSQIGIKLAEAKDKHHLLDFFAENLKTWDRFRLFWDWRLYSLKQEWKLRLKPMTIGRLKWANLKKIRPKHFGELYDGIRRSVKIVSGNSTNPYE